MRSPTHVLCLATSCVLTTLSCTATAGVTNWTNNSGGAFLTPSNWSAGVPGPDDTAQFLTLNAYIVTLAQSHTLDRVVVRSAAPSLNLNSHTLTLLGSDRLLPSLAVGALTTGVGSLTIWNGTLVSPDVVVAPDAGSGSITLGGGAGGGHLVSESVLIGKTWSGTLSVGTNSSLTVDLLTLGHALNAPVSVAFGSAIPSVIHDRLELGVRASAQCSISSGKVTVEGDLVSALEPGGSATLSANSTSGRLDVFGTCDLGIAGPTTVSFATGGRMVAEGPFIASGTTTLQFRLESASTALPARLTLKGPVDLSLGPDDGAGSATSIIATLPTPAIPAIGTTYHLITSVEPAEWPAVSVPPTTLTRRYVVSTTPHQADVVVAAGLADLNGDNTITLADLSPLLHDWGASQSAADLNSDGTVDAYDLAILLSAL